MRIKINQKVLRGQPLNFSNCSTVLVHSPTSGWIQDISFYLDPINQNNQNIKITIISDFLDKWIRLKPIHNYKHFTPEKLIQIIHQSGIVGLGGSEFPSAKKLTLSINKVDTLIVNAVESEPYVTSDYCLINNYMNEILIGCKIIAWISKIKIVLIAIQEDKLKSISNISTLIKNNSLFKICIIKKKYPAGSSKVLIKSLTGKEIPYNKHSIDIGYLVFNVATIYAIKRAVINGEPLIERIVTFLGDNNSLLGNFLIRIGTPINNFLVNKKIKNFSKIKIYSGGPFMGERIYDLDYCILKKTNCISIYTMKKKYVTTVKYPCIRCGYCSSACPVNLLPQQLYWYSKNKNHKETKKYHILDCIECNICEKVCPSHIRLVKYFKKEKDILKNIQLQNDHKKLSYIRFKNRKTRLLNEKKLYNIELIKNNKIVFKSNIINNIEKENKNNNVRKMQVQEAIQRMKSKQ